MMRTLALVVLAAACQNAEDDRASSEVARAVSCDTGQIFGNAQHTGIPCVGLSALHIVGAVTIDPDAQRESDDLGFYSVHAPAAITAGEWVYAAGKRGYTSPFDKSTQLWTVQALRWTFGRLEPQWTFDTQWRPIDAIAPFGATNGYESLFQPALHDNVLYVPGPAGTVHRINAVSGELLASINPFAGTAFDGDPDTIVDGGITVGDDGTVAYVVVAWDHSGSPSEPPRGSWLVKAAPSQRPTIVPWTSIATRSIGVKQATELCTFPFAFASPVPPRPWPPTPDAAPPLFECGAQRPPVNATPAFTNDGRIVVISTANDAISYAYLIAIDATTLTPVWSASLRDQIHDGCGVLTPFDNADPFACRVGSHLGVDPQLNEPVAGRNTGIMEVAPMVAPDGSIYVGSYSGSYDLNRGHLFRFSAAGQFLGLFDFGWESTPAVVPHGGTFSLVMDNNHNSPFTGDGTGPGGDYVTARLSPDLRLEAETHIAQRDDAVANDYLDGQAATDITGNAYVLNAQGVIQQVAPSGAVLASVDLGISMETLSAEMSWGTSDLGRPVLYVPYAGTLWAISDTPTVVTTHAAPARSALPRGTTRRGQLRAVLGTAVHPPVDDRTPRDQSSIESGAGKCPVILGCDGGGGGGGDGGGGDGGGGGGGGGGGASCGGSCDPRSADNCTAECGRLARCHILGEDMGFCEAVHIGP